jgi:hypothetical protein
MALMVPVRHRRECMWRERCWRELWSWWGLGLATAAAAVAATNYCYTRRQTMTTPSTSSQPHTSAFSAAGQDSAQFQDCTPCRVIGRPSVPVYHVCPPGQLTSPGRKRNLCRPRRLHLCVWPFPAQGAGGSHPPEQALFRHGQPQSSPDRHVGRLRRPGRLQMVRLSIAFTVTSSRGKAYTNTSAVFNMPIHPCST